MASSLTNSFLLDILRLRDARGTWWGEFGWVIKINKTYIAATRPDENEMEQATSIACIILGIVGHVC